MLAAHPMYIKKLLLTCLAALVIPLAWHSETNELAMSQVDAGLKRSLITFGAARALNGIISVAQGTEVVAQPLGFGVSMSIGQVLAPVNHLVEQFSNLMLATSVAFGVEKLLLTVFGDPAVSGLVTAIALIWIVCLWGGGLRPWLTRLFMLVMFVRFALPIATIGSGMIYEHFAAHEYTANQRLITDKHMALTPSSKDTPNAVPACDTLACVTERWFAENEMLLSSPIEQFRTKITDVKRAANQAVDGIVSLMVIFILQTMLLPIMMIWLYYQALAGVGRSALLDTRPPRAAW